MIKVMVFIIYICSLKMLMGDEVVMVRSDFPMEEGAKTVTDIFVTGEYTVGSTLAFSRPYFVKTNEASQKMIRIDVPFALGKVIFSDNGISVFRQTYKRSLDRIPNILIFTPMVGDRVIKNSAGLINELKEESGGTEKKAVEKQTMESKIVQLSFDKTSF